MAGQRDKTFPVCIRIVAAMLAIGVSVAGCGKGKSDAKAPPPMAPLVNAADVVVRDVPYYIEEIGRCSSSDMVSLMPQVAGRIESAHFEQGADVKKGDLLYTIDPRPFKAVVAQNEA